MYLKRFLIPALLLIALPGVAQKAKKDITLEDLWQKGTFRMKSVPGFNAMRDGVRYTQLDAEGGSQRINTYDLATGKKGDVLFNNGDAQYNGQKLSIDDYAFSDDEKKLLLATESENIYRRSVLRKVYIYDIASKALSILDTGKVLHAQFSPDGSKVAFVKNNNLYYRDLNSAKTIQVTFDGKRNEIINGNCDWVYEEEFEFTQAYQWSPDSKYIAYYKFDERQVPEYTMTIYDNLYPTPYKYKYPKAGEKNSIVNIYFYNVDGRKSTIAEIARPEYITKPNNGVLDIYVPRIKWSADPSKLCILKMNRHQNKLDYMLTDAASGKAENIYTEENKAYIEIDDNLQFLADKHSFLFTSEQDGWNHFYIYDFKNKKLTKLTKGDFDAEACQYIDETEKNIYYTAAKESPMERKLYSVGFDGNNDHLLTPENGVHAITPCAGGKFFLDRFSSLTTPAVYYLRDNTGKTVRVLEDNNGLENTMRGYNMGTVKFFQPTGADGQKLNAYMITPPNFDASKKYPVLMYQYSGPNSQQVADKFPLDNYFFHQMLAEKGYIIVVADGTGTGFRGEAFRKKTYLQLGKYESDDQIAVARYMAGQPYVDKARIGIWGWSYGGFMSSTCIFKGADVFKMAIAVAPVTNWRYYDNIYTERYMRTPQENKDGYDDNAPEKMADKLKGKFLLVHGTGDDNVHVQNSMSLINNLVRADKEYDSEFYPNRTHGISGGNTRLHLYKRMTAFILDNL